jgi:hypothetical protein
MWRRVGNYFFYHKNHNGFKFNDTTNPPVRLIPSTKPLYFSYWIPSPEVLRRILFVIILCSILTNNTYFVNPLNHLQEREY